MNRVQFGVDSGVWHPVRDVSPTSERKVFWEHSLNEDFSMTLYCLVFTGEAILSVLKTLAIILPDRAHCSTFANNWYWAAFQLKNLPIILKCEG